MNEAKIRPSVPNPRDNHSRRNVGEVVMLCGLTLLDHQDQDTALTPRRLVGGIRGLYSPTTSHYYLIIIVERYREICPILSPKRR
jgi:hypothetical protein